MFRGLVCSPWNYISAKALTEDVEVSFLFLALMQLGRTSTWLFLFSMFNTEYFLFIDEGTQGSALLGQKITLHFL